jgi:hypothetical protein
MSNNLQRSLILRENLQVVANDVASAKASLAKAERALEFLQAQNNSDYLRWVREENLRKTNKVEATS